MVLLLLLLWPDIVALLPHERRFVGSVVTQSVARVYVVSCVCFFLGASVWIVPSSED